MIELNENHYIVVDDSEIKKHDWYFNHPNKEICQSFFNRIPLEFGKCEKITHSTKPIEKLSNGDDVFITINELNLSEAKALVGIDIEQLAEQYAKAHSIYESGQDDVAYGFKEGYNQCLEYNKNKKYTENDIFNAIGIAIGLWSPTYASFEQGWKEVVLKSLQPKKEWEVTFENGKLKLQL